MSDIYLKSQIPQELIEYFIPAEIGLEATPDEFVAKLVAVFREVKRVLRDDGTCWVNLGDTFAANRGYQVVDHKHKDVGNSFAMKAASFGVKPKCLIGIPWMTAFALRADGWYLRSDIIWAKGCSGDYKGGNVMPESVKDRPTRAHEYLFLLSKSERYFYDQNAINEPDQESGERNMRSVWTVKTKPYSGAHFATFPEKLVEPCIMAGTSQAGCCSECGKPYQRMIEKQGITAHDGDTDSAYKKNSTANRLALLRQAARERGEEYSNKTTTLGFEPDCTCNAKAVPCVVLDPFGGSGTVGAVAERLGRNSILIELNPEYVVLAEQRTAQSGLLLEVA